MCESLQEETQIIDPPQAYANQNVPYVPPSLEVHPLVHECNNPYENDCQNCRRENVILETSHEAA